MPFQSIIPLEERADLVRQALKQQQLDGFIITRGDEYLGEYVAPYAERLAWLTGFTGSAGLAILLDDAGCVFSDGRYTVQLEEQVPHRIWERRHSVTPPPGLWLAEHGQAKRIGYDPRLITQNQRESWLLHCIGRDIELVPVARNPVDIVWSDQPSPPEKKITRHALKLAGESSSSKRERLAEKLRESGQAAMMIADCTSIMWLLNLRGSDVPMTPLAHGYALLYADASVDYFVQSFRIDPSLSSSMLEEGITCRDPQMLESCLKQFSGQKVRLDANTVPVLFADRLKKYGAEIAFEADLCSLPKAIKNKIEQEGSRQAHELDSLALARFLFWLEGNAIGKKETELAGKLEYYRAASPDYKGASFETISASGPNGAYPHYRAEKGKDRTIEENSVYLVDSGGQYPFGTTDITRTLWIGTKDPDDALKEAYTRVLKGHIALATACFPCHIPGYRLDSLARAPLWEAGLDYDHGTGHGIGSYLSVHEGPQNISPAPRAIGLEAGMILSNEPGYYAVGQYGIRIENLLLVIPASQKQGMAESRNFLSFETLSFTPIDRRLIDSSLLDEKELAWFTHYHQEVEKRLLPLIASHCPEEEQHPLRSWLKRLCAPLSQPALPVQEQNVKNTE